VKVEVPGTQEDSVKFGAWASLRWSASRSASPGRGWPGVKLVPSVPVPAAAEASARELTGAPLEPKPAETPVAPVRTIGRAHDKPPASECLVS
jgi:hypothetical protein